MFFNQITECNLLRVWYTSLDDWQTHRDILRCNQTVFGTWRSDCAQISTDHGVQFIRLHFMFDCKAFGHTWHVARVSFFKEVTRVDSAPFQMQRVSESKQGNFILVENIIRGAFLSPDPKHSGHFFVNDLIDNDMFLRVE